MRNTGLIIAAVWLSLSSPVSAGFGIPVEVKGVSRYTPNGPIYLLVRTNPGGDGASKGVLRIACAGGRVESAGFRFRAKGTSKAAARAPSMGAGHPTGIPKKWQTATPQLRAMRPVVPAALLSTPSEADGWVPAGLANAEELCSAAEHALGKAKKSR